MQARSLTVVLYEPSDVEMPLETVASFPANALGRCALTTAAIAERFRDAAPQPCRSRWDSRAMEQWTWLDGLLPQRDADAVAEVDGAAAMLAAVPKHASDWALLEVEAREVTDWGW